MRVCVLDDWEGAALTSADWRPVREIGGTVDVVGEPVPADALAERLHGYDVVVAMRERSRFDRALLERLPDLRLLVTTGPRNAAIDLAACRDLGITVCATRGGGTPVVELAWALILAGLRDVAGHAARMAGGQWRPTLGTDLEGATLGLVGLGRTGRRMAAIGAAFGMRVLAWSPHLTPERAAEAGATSVGKADLFTGSDVVSLHLVLSPETRGVVGPAELAAMRPDALLVNTSRAGLVDTAALHEALHGGRIGGAAVDVFDAEPLPTGDPWRTTPGALLTPHVGYVTRGTFATWFHEVVEDVVTFAAGAPIRVLT